MINLKDYLLTAYFINYQININPKKFLYNNYEQDRGLNYGLTLPMNGGISGGHLCGLTRIFGHLF